MVAMILDFNKFKQTPLKAEPYRYLVIEDFINTEHLAQIIKEFPPIITRGSFPLESLQISDFFNKLVVDFFSPQLRALTEEKFGINLQKTAGMLTLRGHTGKEDGKIHIDSKGKVITFLLYLNDNWQADQGGNLRILNNAHDIEDFAHEVQPKAGTLVVFECSENAWHGHLPFVGARQSLQFNYVKNNCYLTYEKYRHRLSAFIKKLKNSLS